VKYLHAYLFFSPSDIAYVQNLDGKMDALFVLKRFVPRSNDVLEEQLDLSQFEVVISNSLDMCVRFQAVVIRVSEQCILCQHLKSSTQKKIGNENRVTQIQM
jgi:hypothetical protein